MGIARTTLSPPRSPFHPPVSPPPSESLLKLQKLGLELGPSASKSSLHIPSYNTSPRTTPSDLDKPLPLEPPELRRRTSSIYSNETTISNILELYGGQTNEDIDDDTEFHSAQAYRATVAPLLARRLSLTHSTWVPPIIPHKLKTSVSIPLMRPAEHSPSLSTADSKIAPSFVEFSRNLHERRNDMVSPLSTPSHEHYRQEALERLAPPSPQDSSEALSVAYEQPHSFLPGPMSGTITDVVASEFVPRPLDLSRTSRILRSPQEASGRARDERLDHPTQSYQQPNTPQSWTRVMDRLNKGKSSEDKEKQRVLQYASEKYPAMKSAQQQQSCSNRSSGGSITRRASNLIQAFSPSGGKNNKSPTSATTPRRQKQLAVKTTPYQDYGPDIWLPQDKKERKQKREQRKLQRAEREPEQQYHRRQRPSTTSKAWKGSVGSAYHSGQSQIVGVLEGAKQRLSRSASEKRREKLKKSIVFVGPRQITREKNSFEGAGGWT